MATICCKIYPHDLLPLYSLGLLKIKNAKHKKTTKVWTSTSILLDIFFTTGSEKPESDLHKVSLNMISMPVCFNMH